MARPRLVVQPTNLAQSELQRIADALGPGAVGELARVFDCSANTVSGLLNGSRTPSDELRKVIAGKFPSVIANAWPPARRQASRQTGPVKRCSQCGRPLPKAKLEVAR